jgi:hypothetical protein
MVTLEPATTTEFEIYGAVVKVEPVVVAVQLNAFPKLMLRGISV